MTKPSLFFFLIELISIRGRLDPWPPYRQFQLAPGDSDSTCGSVWQIFFYISTYGMVGRKDGERLFQGDFFYIFPSSDALLRSSFYTVSEFVSELTRISYRYVQSFIRQACYRFDFWTNGLSHLIIFLRYTSRINIIRDFKYK